MWLNTVVKRYWVLVTLAGLSCRIQAFPPFSLCHCLGPVGGRRWRNLHILIDVLIEMVCFVKIWQKTFQMQSIRIWKIYVACLVSSNTNKILPSFRNPTLLAKHVNRVSISNKIINDRLSFIYWLVINLSAVLFLGGGGCLNYIYSTSNCQKYTCNWCSKNWIGE